MENVVQIENNLRFVENEGVKYISDDLPNEGTEVSCSFYVGTDDNFWGDFTWTADTPSGESFARIKGTA
jgi:hypothetical protein